IHQRQADVVRRRVQQVFQRLNLAEHMQSPGEEMNRHPHVALLHSADGRQGRSHPFRQRGLGEVTPPASESDIATKLADGSFDAKWNRRGQFKSSLWDAYEIITSL